GGGGGAGGGGGGGGAKPQDGKDGEKIVASDQAAAPAAVDEKKASEGTDPPDLVPFIFGAVFLALGGALHFKVRQLQRNGGVEPSDDEGAPAP
ncbi:MAG: hypothetical protein EA423_02090, partial [Phycisphaerales bacterium]